MPHPDVDLFVVNGQPVGFSYRPSPGDRIAACPMFEALDVHDRLAPLTRCLRCNGPPAEVNKDEVIDELEPPTRWVGLVDRRRAQR